MLLYFLSLINTISKMYTYYLNLSKKTVNAILNSQTPDVWIFPQRNGFPWIRKDAGDYFCYYPDILKFGTDARKSFDDLVTAEIVDSTGKLLLDCTEFFHNIRWTDAPSIYELILIFLLSKDIILKDEVFLEHSLRVMTLENPDLSIKLKNPKAKEVFSTWSAFEV
jgi:hypothetical protein